MVTNETKWFYLEPLLFSDWIHLAGISKKLKKNHTVVRKYLNVFEKESVLVKKRIGRVVMYKFNLSHPSIMDVISIVEKEKIINLSKKSLLLKEVVNFFKDKNLPVVVIFGSFVVDQKEAEDVDVLIVGEKQNFKEIESKLNKKFHVIYIKNIKEIGLPLKEEIRKKHLIIKGVEEIVKWLI